MKKGLEFISNPANTITEHNIYQLYDGSRWHPLGNQATISWSDITGKPTTFPPEAHTHTKSEITDFPTEMPPTAHSHASDSWFTSALEDMKRWVKALLPKWLTPDRDEPPTLESVAAMIRTAVANFDPDEQSFADLVNILKNIGA